VTAGRTIARLEALLARVRARAAEPRAARGAQPASFVPDRPVEAAGEEDDQPTLPPPSIVYSSALSPEGRERPAATAVAAPPESDGAPEIERVREEEVEEEAPVSSRRPVVPEPEERLAELAFGAEEPSPPRHTPPPESGRLPAAPAAQFEASGGTNADAEQPAIELAPEAIRGPLASGAQVVDVIGAAQRFAPSSFVELLDASLAL